MRIRLTLLLGFALTCVSAVSAEFSVKQIRVTNADRARAMRERPCVFGCGIIWDGRSTIYELPEDFNRLLKERIDAAGVTATRFGFDWATIEQNPGEYDWEIPEKRKGLERLLEMDIEVIGLIATTPGWATPTGEAGTYAPSEESAEFFEAFCAALARRYRGRIRYYQFGNNMDIDNGWLPKADPAAYARWLRRARVALKRGDPECVVSTGGFIGRSAAFLGRIYEEVGPGAFDAVSVHPWPAYESPQGDEAFDWQRIEDYRAVMVKHGDGKKPMWCTEFGWPFEKIGPDKQGEFAKRALDYLVYYEFITVGIYLTMSDYHRGDAGLFGLCDKDLKPRPAFEVWRTTVKPLRDVARPVPVNEKGEVGTRPASTKPLP